MALADLIRSENNGKIPLELANQLNAYRTTLITRQSEHIKIRARELSPEVELLSKVARGPFVIEHVSIGKPGGTPSILR